MSRKLGTDERGKGTSERRDALCMVVYNDKEAQLGKLQRARQPSPVAVGICAYEVAAV